MKRMKAAAVFTLFVISCQHLSAKDQDHTRSSKQSKPSPAKILTYKKVGDRELTLHCFLPDGFKPSDSRPAFVAIHGGGWVSGTPVRFYRYANALSEKGYVGISVEYRLVNAGKGITVFDCIKDGRSAIRYIRGNAQDLGIDPKRIAVSGGSAGAHIAAGTALFDGIDHADDDLTIPCRPDAMILFFPVIDTSTNGYGNQLIGEKWAEISPVNRVKAGAPPTLVFHGDADKTTPYNGSKLFTEKMNEAGNICELVTHPGGGHGHTHHENIFPDAIRRTEAFLSEHIGGGE